MKEDFKMKFKSTII